MQQQLLLIVGFLLVKALISFDKLANDEGLVISALRLYQNNKPTQVTVWLIDEYN